MKEKYYMLNLYDCATPGFVSFTKEYFGSLDDIETLIKRAEVNKESSLRAPFEKLKQGIIEKYHAGHIEVKFAVPITLIAKQDISSTAFRYEFINIWGFPYFVDIDKLQGELAAFKWGKKYVVCYKVRLKNMRVTDDLIGKDLPPLYIGNGFWGYPGMLHCKKVGKNGYTSNALYMTESIFDTKEAALARLNGDAPLNLNRFFEDVFADG